MEELINFQKEIKDWDIEKLLKEIMWCYHYSIGSINDGAKEEYEGKILLLKMEIVSRTK